MHFVNNIDFIACRNGPIANAFDNFAGIINTGMAGSVNFQNINMTSCCDGFAWLALTTWFKRGVTIPIGTNTIQPLGKKARR